MMIADRLGGQNRSHNSLDLMRTIAAGLVILSHSYVLAGSSFEPGTWLTHYYAASTLAVQLFFVLSGFLITKSWCDDSRLSAFALKRVARIVPALVASTVVVTLVLGPLLTTLPLASYFRDPATWSYLYNNLTFVRMQYLLPGVFVHLPVPYAVNGSLWSLTVEMYLYVAVPLLALCGAVCRRDLRMGLALLAIGLMAWDWHDLARPERAGFVSCWLDVRSSNSCVIYFVAGALLYHYRQQVPLRGGLFFLALTVLVTTWRTPHAGVGSFLALPYLVVYLGLKDWAGARWFSRWGDPSYGLYVYAFPIQQTLVYWRRDMSPEVHFPLALFLTSVVSYASWHLLEKRALRMARNFLKARRRLEEVAVSPLSRAA